MVEQDDFTDRVTVLRQEVHQLREAVASHAVVDQAIGMVVALGGMRPDEGWQVLKSVSQHTNTKLREVARHLVEWPQRGRLPDDIRRSLETALAARTGTE
ncbi:ANTAR domain-containing protein [Streptomyces sp. p1417]|uniref:ANTAR domain-containing protein n=1 Tax=Streptomyces typhae TaxID=2681492 RepID=A0A6L6X6T0_9ACTN|nr:ANTAR domain-containing protein [Streptomyces typhae]MVO89512.1 ANTAR domain-containing protein [Streptomyces typhae]